jgi:uncharacterized metal-binding protein
MQELYVDDVTKNDVEPHVDVSEKSDSYLNVEGDKSNCGTETLEIQKGVTGDNTTVTDTVGEGIVQDSPDAEGTTTDQVVEEVMNSLKDTIPEPNVVPDVETSLA